MAENPAEELRQAVAAQLEIQRALQEAAEDESPTSPGQ